MTALPVPSPAAGAAVDPAARLRILWLTSSADTDGPGRALLALLGGWRDADRLAVTALREVTDAFRREAPAGIELTAIGMRGFHDALGIGRLIRHCRAFAPDVIHTQLSRADWIGRLVARVLGVPCVSTIHNLHSRMYRSEFRPATAALGLALDRLTAPLAGHLVAVSDGVRRDMVDLGIPDARVTVIRNVMDLSKRAAPLPRAALRARWGAAPDDIVVGTIALLKTQKGIEHLVDAAASALARCPSLRFVQVGDGPLESQIRARIRAAGIGDRFHLAGRSPDAAALLSGFDMFVLPSLWEGLPLALIEAMCAALPVIGTRVSGINELIDHRRTGLLVPPGAPAALADAVLELAGDPAFRARLGSAAAAERAKFGAAMAVDAHRQVYARVLTTRDRIGRPAAAAAPAGKNP